MSARPSEASKKNFPSCVTTRAVIDAYFEARKVLGELAGVLPVICHRFRDTFTAALRRAGVDLLTIAKWATHENLETLKLYDMGAPSRVDFRWKA